MQKSSRRILLARTDRIGDVVLTLPMVDRIREALPDATVGFLARTYTRELVEQYPGVDAVHVVDGPSGGPSLTDQLRTARYDAVIHVFPRPDITWATVRAGIPVRVGTAYRWYSFLYTQRISGHRRGSGLHEAVLNARLLEGIGVEPPDRMRPRLYPTPAHDEGAKRVLVRAGLSRGESYIVLHPGSGGSARDWRPAHFGGLARELASRGKRVIVTGGDSEVDLADQVVRESGGSAVSAAGELSLMELAAFVSHASLFVSNSTGPLHIAAAVGTPVIGFFPPIEDASVQRWGPLGEHVATFVPDKLRCEVCRGGECRGNNCMDQITVGMVLARAMEMMRPSVEA